MDFNEQQALFRSYLCRKIGPIACIIEITRNAANFQILKPVQLNADEMLMLQTFSCDDIARRIGNRKWVLVKRRNVINGQLIEAEPRRNGTFRKKLKTKKSKLMDSYVLDLETHKHSRRVSRPSWIDSGFVSWCAVKVQSIWRMSHVYRRLNYRKRTVYTIAAMTIQTSWRAHISMLVPKPSRPSAIESAFVIQRSWRCYCNRRVYFFFRDLVLFKLKGMPQDLLKTIIPREVSVCEKAAGIHLRFRLGGMRFPPKIYFKIFTHRAVCDVGRCRTKHL
jgi:hypothetical protein